MLTSDGYSDKGFKYSRHILFAPDTICVQDAYHIKIIQEKIAY